MSAAGGCWSASVYGASVLAGRRERLALGGDAAGEAREQVLENFGICTPAEAHDANLSVNGPIVTTSAFPIG